MPTKLELGTVVTLKPYLGTINERGIVTFATEDAVIISTTQLGGDLFRGVYNYNQISTRHRIIGADELPPIKSIGRNEMGETLPDLDDIIDRACGFDQYHTEGSVTRAIALAAVARKAPERVRTLLNRVCITQESGSTNLYGTVAQLLAAQHLFFLHAVSPFSKAVWDLFTPSQRLHYQLLAQGADAQKNRKDLTKLRAEELASFQQTRQGDKNPDQLAKAALRARASDVNFFPPLKDSLLTRRPDNPKVLPPCPPLDQKPKTNIEDYIQAIQQYCFHYAVFPPDKSIATYLPPHSIEFLSKRIFDEEFFTDYTSERGGILDVILPLLPVDTQIAWLLKQDPKYVIDSQAEPYELNSVLRLLTQAKLSPQQYQTIQERIQTEFNTKIDPYGFLANQPTRTQETFLKCEQEVRNLLKACAITLAKNQLKAGMANKAR